jgi:hypothetical protein
LKPWTGRVNPYRTENRTTISRGSIDRHYWHRLRRANAEPTIHPLVRIPRCGRQTIVCWRLHPSPKKCHGILCWAPCLPEVLTTTRGVRKCWRTCHHTFSRPGFVPAWMGHKTRGLGPRLLVGVWVLGGHSESRPPLEYLRPIPGLRAYRRVCCKIVGLICTAHVHLGCQPCISKVPFWAET